jgi:probable rRNA maturation factor
MIDFVNKTDFNFNVELLNDIYNHLTDRDIELIFVNDEEIRELNKTYRNKDKATDVLSFPLEEAPFAPLGSIIISVDTAKRVAKDLGHSVEDEIKLLFIHGLLHLLGYDHEVDNGEMREKEEELIKKFNLPKSLIVRSLHSN